MANVALICLYDHRALGLRAISNALQAAGHETVVIHFKLPINACEQQYLEDPTHYEAIHTSDLTNGFAIRKYNYDVNPWTTEELNLLREILSTLCPDVIGISTRSAYQPFLSPIAAAIRSVPGAVTVAGGFGATFDVERCSELFDYVCVGEGEQTMLQLSENVDKGKSIKKINNLAYRNDERIEKNPLILPSEEDFLYNFSMGSVTHLVIENGLLIESDILLRQIHIPHADAAAYHTMAGLGCLNNCSYCCAGRMVNLYKDVGSLPKRRLRPIQNVIEELKFAKGYGFGTITFLDSFLVAPREYLLDLFDVYALEVGLPFFAQFHPAQILDHPDILEKALQAGLNFTVIGIQSGSDRINRDIFNRPMPTAQVLELAALFTHYQELFFQYHIITHNPFVDKQAFGETLDLIRLLPKEHAELVLIRLRPFPGTDIAARIEASPAFTFPDTALLHKRAIFYLLRFYLDNNEFDEIIRQESRHTFASLRDTFIKQVIRAGRVQRFGSLEDSETQRIETGFYRVYRDLLSSYYEKALSAWLSVPSAGNRERLEKVLQEESFAHIPQTPNGVEIDLSGTFFGTGWGRSETNIHGQKWRWIGPTGTSTVMIILDKRFDYFIETLIHTAEGDYLIALKVEVNGFVPKEQQIVREGDLFFHRCNFSGSKVGVNGRTTVCYKLTGSRITDNPLPQLVALTRLRVNRL
ncbi:MAG: cobalamin B12-binding domain-containing protein [Deltaproteobacteria bacterium]|nr:cobalamin B12-binding domain-containing protein [Deltaproteobacteria bacterium]